MYFFLFFYSRLLLVWPATSFAAVKLLKEFILERRYQEQIRIGVVHLSQISLKYSADYFFFFLTSVGLFSFLFSVHCGFVHATSSSTASTDKLFSCKLAAVRFLKLYSGSRLYWTLAHPSRFCVHIYRNHSTGATNSKHILQESRVQYHGFHVTNFFLMQNLCFLSLNCLKSLLSLSVQFYFVNIIYIFRY